MSQTELAAAVCASRQTIRSIELERSTPSVNLRWRSPARSDRPSRMFSTR
jgi:hypothetical protein